jgi:ketosteroid isomerase-like protein
MDPLLVADRLELRDLVDGYARAADGGDRAALEALFLPDATLTVRRPDAEPHTYEGAAALGEIVPRLGRYARTFHLVANHWCTVNGDAATGEAYCEAHHVRTDGSSATDVVLTICYVDAYARTTDGWRFASREVQILWTHEVPLVQFSARR